MPYKEHQNSDLWDVLWDDSIVGIVITNSEGQFVKANSAFCNIVEYTEQELLKKTFMDITMPSDAQASKDLADDIRSGRKDSVDIIKGYQTKTNRVVWAHVRVVPFKQNGQFLYFVTQVFEIPSATISHGQRTDNAVKSDRPTLISSTINRLVPIRDWIPFIISGLVGIGLVFNMFFGG